MGCNCGGSKKVSTYQYTTASGNVRTFRSQLEARAAQIRDERAGLGSGSIKELQSA